MNVIRPVALASAMLVSSSVPETDFPAYSAGTSYALGDNVIVVAEHACYRSLSAGNLGNAPATSPAKWRRIGPTNRWAPFDQVVGTVCTGASPMVIVLAPGLVDAAALLDVSASSVRLEMIDGATTVYDRTISLESADDVLDWYDYYYAPIRRNTVALFLDLPPYSGAHIRITLTGAATVSVGTIVLGRKLRIGELEYGAEAGITSFSRVKYDEEFGTFSVTKRPYRKDAQLTVAVATGAFDTLSRELAALDSTPVIWLGADDKFEAFVIFGIARKFRLILKYARESVCSLDITGLV